MDGAAVDIADMLTILALVMILVALAFILRILVSLDKATRKRL